MEILLKVNLHNVRPCHSKTFHRNFGISNVPQNDCAPYITFFKQLFCINIVENIQMRVPGHGHATLKYFSESVNKYGQNTFYFLFLILVTQE